MKHKDLFSGIGGFALAARMVWGEQQKPVLFCEKEPYARRVLNKNFPGVSCVEDIRDLRGEPHVTTDLVTAGLPCQPFSVAGKQTGKEDDRYLWPETLRFLQEDQPRWFIGENVPGIINLALDEMLASLEGSGYETETLIIPACAVNAPHRRDRLWIVAYSKSTDFDSGSQRQQKQRQRITDEPEFNGLELCRQVIANAESQQNRGIFKKGFSTDISAGCDWTRQTEAWSTQPGICGVAHGIPKRVDRLRALGNAIVPQVAAVLMSGIKEIEEETIDTTSNRQLFGYL